MDPETGFCAGCGRTLQEIAGWAACSGEERRRIMALLPARLAMSAAFPEDAPSPLAPPPEQPA
jgi:predicted Fe-S protein YdhL (DUF1289 family)